MTYSGTFIPGIELLHLSGTGISTALGKGNSCIEEHGIVLGGKLTYNAHRIYLQLKAVIKIIQIYTANQILHIEQLQKSTWIEKTKTDLFISKFIITVFRDCHL